MRFLAPLIVAMLFVVFLASCAVEREKPPERAEEQKELEEVENLSVGQKAELYGMNISVDDVYATRTPADISMKRDKGPEQGKIFVVVTVTVEGTEAQANARPINIKDLNFSAEDENGHHIPKVAGAFSYGGLRPVYDITGDLLPGQRRTGPLAYQSSETSEMTFKFQAVSGVQDFPTVRWKLGPVSEME